MPDNLVFMPMSLEAFKRVMGIHDEGVVYELLICSKCGNGLARAVSDDEFICCGSPMTKED